MSRSGSQEKPFVIPKQLVWEAYKRVKANKGAPGVDRQSPEEFESDLSLRFNLGCLPLSRLPILSGVSP